MCRLFHRLSTSDKNTVWPHYGIFASLASIGSFLGAFETVGYMQYNSLRNAAMLANATFADSESRRVNALAWRWFGAQHALLGPTFLFLTIAKLFVLKRLVDFFLPKLAAQSQRRVAVCERVTAAAVAAATVVITCCGFACCYYATRIAAQDIKYADAFDAGDLPSLRPGILAERKTMFEPLQLNQALLYSFQVSVLVRAPLPELMPMLLPPLPLCVSRTQQLLSIAAFAVAAFFCKRRISQVLSAVAAPASKLARARDDQWGGAQAQLKHRILGKAKVCIATLIRRPCTQLRTPHTHTHTTFFHRRCTQDADPNSCHDRNCLRRVSPPSNFCISLRSGLRSKLRYPAPNPHTAVTPAKTAG